MGKAREPRKGEVLSVKKQQIDFSFWITRKGQKRFGLQPRRIFVADPWGIIRNSIETKCTDMTQKAALAFCTQAEDYFRAAIVSGIVAAKPVLLYYSMLNIAKAFVLVKGVQPRYAEGVYHGLSENIPSTGALDFINSVLDAHPSSASSINVFDDFLKTINGGEGLLAKVNYKMEYLAPQIIQAHRLYCASAEQTERFIPIHKINLMHDITTKSIWLDMLIYDDELCTKNITHKRFLKEANLDFQEVKCDEKDNGRKIVRFEQKDVMSYNDRPSDKVADLIATIKNNLWTSVLSVPPYRKYYTYLSPEREKDHRLPQLASIYTVFYYFGSVTRYRPYNFDEILSGVYGGYIREIIETVPNQFLYLLASEFCEQEITKASIL